jgi:hypothetical protein
VFTLDPSEVREWKDDVRKGKHSDATRIQVLPQELSFGDGTGYFVNSPYPPVDRKQPFNRQSPASKVLQETKDLLAKRL